jgi:two-component system response regulator MtrA
MVLVVDDDDDIKAAASIKFRDAGLDVRGVSSGNEALDVLREGSVDILLLDVWMPLLDGFDVVRRVRLEQPGLKIPIFLMTAATDRHQIAFAMNLGVEDILEKSAGLDAMAARLWFTLRERGF